MAIPTPPEDQSRSGRVVDYSDASFLELANPKASTKSTPLPELRLPPITARGKSSQTKSEAEAQLPPPVPQSQSGPLEPATFVLDKWTQVSLPAVPSVQPDASSQPSLESIPVLEPSGRPSSSAKTKLGRIGPYQLRQLIGEGGMGLVYQAEDLLLKRMVALKIMKPDLARARAAWRLFLKEAQTTAAIKNDRIATIYQVGEAGDQFYLAMELLKGETLETRLKRGRMSLKQALWIAKEAALGLAVAHDAGLVHRDIKPANLWLESKIGSSSQFDQFQDYRPPIPGEIREPNYGRVKILDFGLAQLAHETTGRGNTSGTPGYMAPEQANGRTGDERTDIFSLGVVIFRMVTGRMPFQGNSPMELLTAVATQPAPLASMYNPTLPAEMVRLIQKMLSHDPVARPISAAEVALAIDRLETELNRPPAPIAPPSKRRSWPWVLGISIAATVIFGVCWIMYNRKHDDKSVLETTSAVANGVLSPSEAVAHIGDEVTVEFTVRFVERAEDVAYVYESEPSGEHLHFRVAVPAHMVATMRERGSNWPEALNGVRLRLKGMVIRDGRFAEILMADLTQFENDANSGKATSATEKSGAHSRAGTP